jgi:hypothetical protein
VINALLKCDLLCVRHKRELLFLVHAKRNNSTKIELEARTLHGSYARCYVKVRTSGKQACRELKTKVVIGGLMWPCLGLCLLCLRKWGLEANTATNPHTGRRLWLPKSVRNFDQIDVTQSESPNLIGCCVRSS